MQVTSRRHFGRKLIGHKTLATLLAVLLLAVSASADASPLGLADELPSGRLGYKWVPDPPKKPMSAAEQMWLDVAKYGGAVLVGGWLLKKLFGDD